MTEKQKAITRWWRDRPMTYGLDHGVPRYEDGQCEIGTKPFFDRVDARFHQWNRPLHGDRYFSRIFPYERYEGKSVLEVGCGLGTMIMHWAKAGARVVGVDLNPTSVLQSSKRFSLYGVEGSFVQADARSLPFPDASFDYVYSWGVLHHSPDLSRSLQEMQRVLRPGGEFGIMLYNRRSLLYWYEVRYVEGFLHYENRFLGPLEQASRYGDGGREEGNPHTWPVTRREVFRVLEPHVEHLRCRVLGTDLDGVFQLLLPGLGLVIPSWMKKPWARRWGWSLWFSGVRKADS